MNLREQHSTLTVTTSHCVFCRSLQYFKSTRSHYRKRAQHQKWQNTAWEGEGQGFDPVPRVGYTFYGYLLCLCPIGNWEKRKPFPSHPPQSADVMCKQQVRPAAMYRFTGFHCSYIISSTEEDREGTLIAAASWEWHYLQPDESCSSKQGGRQAVTKYIITTT